MQQLVDLIIQFGQYAMGVVGVCVTAMLLVSMIDGFSRDKDTPKDQDPSE